MKSRLIVVDVCLLVFMPCVAVAQSPRASRVSAATGPPPFQEKARVAGRVYLLPNLLLTQEAR